MSQLELITKNLQIDGEGLGESFPDEDDFEKQMHPANESDKTAVRASPSQAQVDQLERWLLEKPIPYISKDNFSQEDIFDYWNGKLPGHAHVKRTYPHVVRCGDSSMVALDLEAG